MPAKDRWNRLTRQSAFHAKMRSIRPPRAARTPTGGYGPATNALIPGVGTLHSTANSKSHGRPPFEPGWAFFLDLDGTLIAIADRPDSVEVPPRLPRILAALSDATAGATAIITGRAIIDVDRLLAPAVLPVAGQHGAERRDSEGHWHRDAAQDQALAAVRPGLADFVSRHPDLILEDKGASLSLHYRGAPRLRQAARQALHEALTRLGPGFALHHGKQVFELRPALIDKGTAIAGFMRTPPFAGRCPVFLGDDVTDEDGFRMVNELGGISIKVGAGPTLASWRFAGPPDVLDWLRRYTEWTGHRSGH